jgi:hypothetical protein
MADFQALLIGIDYYLTNPFFKNLGGAVRDIDKVASYLAKSRKIPAEKVTKLTSPLPNTHSTADARSAELPPTYENIVNAFKTITDTANPGDIVYIHYSGHGGRVKTIFPELKTGENQYDEGLVPMDVGDRGRYLRDVEMATLLKRMADKGLVVTVVFDSCHSGGATRADGEVRGARDGKPDTIEGRPSDSLVASREELLDNWRQVTGDSPQSVWLPNHRNYVFLGACRPTELAYEAAIDGKDRNGALTYFMFDTLMTAGTNLTYQQLYDRIKGQIKSRFPSQFPMLSGESDRLVFGSASKAVPYSLTVVGTTGDRVTLDGGIAQGVSRGSRFALYPVGSDFSDRSTRIAVVEIVELKAEESKAKVLNKAESGVKPNQGAIQAGLPAVMESVPVDLKSRVRLFSKAIGDAEDQLPAELAAKQAEALEKVRQAMAGNGWLEEVTDDRQEGHYQIAVSKTGDYEINQKTPIGNLYPTLAIDDPKAPAEVVKRLVHLAKYNNALGLDSPASELARDVEYELLDVNKQRFADRNHISLQSGDRLYVRLKNVSSQALNVAILDFEATWEISQIPIRGDRGAFYALQPGEETLTRLRFQVPEGEYYQQTVETLKLFVTRGLANFQWLLLPPLDRGKMTEEARGEYRSLRGSLQEATRSMGSTNPFNNLLAMLGAEEPPSVTRASYDPDPDAEWLTRAIEITVTQ